MGIVQSVIAPSITHRRMRTRRRRRQHPTRAAVLNRAIRSDTSFEVIHTRVIVWYLREIVDGAMMADALHADS